MRFTLAQLAAQAIARCRLLATCTETPNQTTRTFLSTPMHEVHNHHTKWAEAAGARVTIDPIGNFRALFGSPTIPRLLIASHLDTVPNAGPFDGILGVALALALIEHLSSPLENLAIEIVGFSEEEGIRFHRPFLGSLAVTGQLNQDHLHLADSQGTTVAEAVQAFHLDPAALSAAKLSERSIAYFEFHIEQGPVLESLNLPLGLVTALVGQTRMELTFSGQANHAGTTPMPMRRDALAAAAEWIIEVESHARKTSGLVATVGRLEVSPGAGNIVPGQASALLDLRHGDDMVRDRSIAQLTIAAQQAAAKRHVTLTHRLLVDQAAVALDPSLTALLAEAAKQAGYPAHPMTSGAGHDAMILAPHLPSAMLFLRSPNGISHHPDETVLIEDVTAALHTGVNFIRALANTIPKAH